MVTYFSNEQYNLLCRIVSIGLNIAENQEKREKLQKAKAQLERDYTYDQSADSVELELEGFAKKTLMNEINMIQLIMLREYDILQSSYGMNGVKMYPLLEKELAQLNMEDLKVLKKELKRKVNPPSRKMYISDLHFYHEGLNYRMDNRGFSSVDELNEYMITQWNSKVTKKDEVYLLGDLSIGKGKETNHILEQLHGKIYLVEGNHDKFLGDKEFDVSRFEWVKSYAEIRDQKRKVVLSHYPLFCYVGQYRKINGVPDTYMLYGHVHDTYDEFLVNQFIQITRNAKRVSRYTNKPEPIPCNMINCFCMYSDYVPLTLDEWIRLDEKRRSALSVPVEKV